MNCRRCKRPFTLRTRTGEYCYLCAPRCNDCHKVGVQGCCSFCRVHRKRRREIDALNCLTKHPEIATRIEAMSERAAKGVSLWT